MEAIDLEICLRNGWPIDQEDAECIVEQNAVDGALLRSAAAEGYLNVVMFFTEAQIRFNLSFNERERCTNKGARDKQGNTLLHIAAHKGHVPVVEYLLSIGANVNIKNKNIETALHRAVTAGHKEVVKILISHNANRLIFSRDYYVALDIAVREHNFEIVTVLLNAGLCGENALLITSEIGDGDMLRLLREHNVSFDYSRKRRVSPLHLAAFNGHLNICQLLLEDHTADLRFADKMRRTPLHCAAEGGHADIVALLVSRGASVEVQDSNDGTPLHYAAANGHVDVSRLLIAHDANVNARKDGFRNNDFESPLHSAARGGHLSVAQCLIEAGAEVNGWAHSRYTPFDVAVRAGKRDVALYLRSLGAVLNKSDMLYQSVKDGRPLAVMCCVAMGMDPNKHDVVKPIYTAIHVGCFDIVRFFLQKGTNANAVDYNEMPPLHGACSKGFESIVKLLVARGASVNSIDWRGRTPLLETLSSTLLKFLVEKGGDPNAVDDCGTTMLHISRPIDQVRILLGYNVLVDARNADGDTPLHLYCDSGNFRIAELLIEHGAAVNTRNKAGHTPLIRALLADRVKCAEVLLKQGADLKATYGNGRTALHLACSGGYVTPVIFLLKHINVNSRDEDGNTPLHEATKPRIFEFGRKAIVNELIKKGAQVNAVNEKGQTPLHNAMVWASQGFIELLITNGAVPLHGINQV